MEEKLTTPLRVKIDVGVRGFVRVGKGAYRNASLSTEIPKNVTSFSFEVVWDRESNNNNITLSTIQGQGGEDVNANLQGINVKMRPWDWEAPSSVSLNEEFTISCSYPFFKGSNIEPHWDYERPYFEEINQDTDPANKKTSITLLPRDGGNADVELSFTKNITYDYGLIAPINLGRKSITYSIAEPEISGEPVINLYEATPYSLSGDNLRDIVWSGENIKIIGGQGTPNVTVVGTKAGQGRIEVSYHTGDSNKDFKKSKDLTIKNVIMQINGTDMVCRQEVYIIQNMPQGATVNWEVRDAETDKLLYSLSDQTSPAITISSDLNKDENSIMVDIRATVNYNTLKIPLWRQVALVKSGIQEAGAYTITGDYNPYGGSFEVYPRPYDATNFHWSIDNGWAASVDNVFFGEFFSERQEPFYGGFYVTVTFDDPCGNQLIVYKYFTTEARFRLSANPVAYDLEIKDDPAADTPRSIRKVKVFSQMGMPVLEEDYPTGSHNVNVNVSTLPEGNYVLQISDGEKWEQHKLIINR